MTIQYVSDIHLEFEDNYDFFVNQQALKPKADILVIAGDIARYTKFKNEKYMKFFKYCSENWKYTIFILGNHDYWGSRIADIPIQLKLFDNVIMLNSDSFTLDNVIFIGTTLWSNISKDQEIAAYYYMRDFQHINYNIYGKSGKLTLLNYHILHSLALNFLDNILPNKSTKIDTDKKYIVITHHAPHFNFNGERQDNNFNTAYYTNLSWFIRQKKIDYWICGHTHYNPEDFKIDDTILTSNSFGYIMDLPVPKVEEKIIKF